jgi:hypothetical protein
MTPKTSDFLQAYLHVNLKTSVLIVIGILLKLFFEDLASFQYCQY